jgi:putative membrane protein
MSVVRAEQDGSRGHGATGEPSRRGEKGPVEEGNEMHGWDGYGWGVWGLTVMTVSMVLFWALIILAIVALVRYLQRSAHSDHGTATAEELLAERFARGEMDEEEYRRRLTALAERRRRT